jgi:hypothetical protein
MFRQVIKQQTKLWNGVVTKEMRFRQVSSFVQRFDQVVDQLPLREAVRYEHKNIKLTASQFRVLLKYSIIFNVDN